MDVLQTAEFSILIPETDSNKISEILNSNTRKTVFYDENLLIYLLMKHSNSSEIGNIVNELDIQLIVKLIMGDQSEHPPVPPRTGLAKNSGEILTCSNYKDGAIIGDGIVLFPIYIYLDLIRKRPSRSRWSRLILTTHLTQSKPSLDSVLCDVDEYDAFNPLSEIGHELLVPNHSKRTREQSNSFKVSTSTTCNIGPLLHLNASCHALNIDKSLLMLAISTGEFTDQVELLSVKVYMADTIINSLEQFKPSVIKYNDRIGILYNMLAVREKRSLAYFPSEWKQESFNSTGSVLNLEASATENVRLNKTLFVQLEAIPHIKGTRMQAMNILFYTHISFLPNGKIQDKDLVMNYGRRFVESINMQESRVASYQGLSVTLNCTQDIRPRQVFGVQILIINTGNRVRNIQIIIPPESPSETNNTQKQDTSSLPMTFEDFSAEYRAQSDQRAAIVCLEHAVSIKPIAPQSCRLVMLHFIVIKDKVHYLPKMILLDQDTKTEMVLKEVLQVYIK